MHRQDRKPNSVLAGYFSVSAGRPALNATYPRAKQASFSALLFGLAPDGVCLAPPVARRAVVSYTAVSPLPAENLGQTTRVCPCFPLAVCFLLHFPLLRSFPRSPLALRGIPALRSSDFPPLPCGRSSQPSYLFVFKSINRRIFFRSPRTQQHA